MNWTAELVRERLNRTVDGALTPATPTGEAHGPRGGDEERSFGHEAAVAIVLRFTPAPEALLIRRAEQESDPWSGHMAFPGGRREQADQDLLATAVRETAEEVGIDLLSDATWLGRLPAMPAVAKGRRIDLVIVPFVFAAKSPLRAIAGPEVDEAVWAELEPLAAGRADTVRPYVFEGYPLELPAFRVGEHVVWGLTYRMLTMLFEALRG